MTILARGQERLAAAADIVPGAATVQADLSDVVAIGNTVRDAGAIDHLVVTAGTLAFGTLAQTQPSDWRAVLEQRIIGPMAAINAASIVAQGSILLFSGGLAHRPAPGSALLSAAMVDVARAGLSAIPYHPGDFSQGSPRHGMAGRAARSRRAHRR